MIRSTRQATAIAGIVAVLLVLVLAADGGGRRVPSHRVHLKPISHNPDESISDLAFSPDGQSLIALVTANVQLPDGPTPIPLTTDTLELWNVRTGQVEWTLQDADDRISEVMFGPDGHTLVMLVADTVELWDVHTHQLITTLDACDRSCPDRRHDCLRNDDECVGDHAYEAAAFSPDGRTLAVGGTWNVTYNAVDIWDYETRTLVTTFTTKTPAVADATMRPRGLYFSADSRRLTGFGDEWGPHDMGARSALATWDVPTRRVVAQVTFGNESINGFDLSRDEQSLALVDNSSGSDIVEIWRLATGKKETTLDCNSHSISAVSFGPGDRILAVAAPDNSVILADTAGDHIATRLTGPETLTFSPVNTEAIGRNGHTIVGVTFDGVALLWDLRSHRFLAAETPECATGCGYTGDTAFTRDDHLLALARQDGAIDIVSLP